MASVIVTIPVADVVRARMLAQMLTDALRSSAGIIISVSPDSETAGVIGGGASGASGASATTGVTGSASAAPSA